jgi:hypothetical protein
MVHGIGPIFVVAAREANLGIESLSGLGWDADDLVEAYI